MLRFDRPRSHEQRAMMLCEFDDEGMQNFIKKKARQQDEKERQQDVEWLTTMLDIGLFDLADERQDTHNWMCRPERTSDRLEALMEFLKETHRSDIIEDPEYGRLQVPASRMHLEASEDMRLFFSRFCDHLCEQRSVLQTKHPERNPSLLDLDAWNRLQHDLETAAARAMVGTCALDLPAATAKLAERFPEAQQIGIAQGLVGNMFHDFPHVVHSLELTPRCYAMLYSNRSCMDALHRAPSEHDTIYASLDVQDGSVRKRECYDLLQAAGSVFPPLCEPSAFGKALAIRKNADGQISLKEWSEQIQKLLEGEENFRSMASYVTAYEREGYFELFPTVSADMACRYGHAGIVERLQGAIDWTQMGENQSLLRAAEHGLKMKSAFGKNQDRFDDAMAAFCQRAIDDGAQDCILAHERLAQHPETNLCYTQPLVQLVEGNFNKTLGKMLDAGLSPTEPPLPMALSPLQMAVLHTKSSAPKGDTSTEGLLRAYSARSTAHDLLGQMDLSAFSLRLA